MNIDRLFSRLLLFCIPLYFTQGWLFESGGMVSQLLIGIWLIADFYYMVYYMGKSRRSLMSNSIIIFWFVNLIYWALSPKEVHALGLSYITFGDFKNLTTVILSFFPFAVLTKKGIIDDNYMRHFAILFLAAAIVAFMTKRETNLASFGYEITNNTGYYFAVILPFLGVFWNNKKFWIGFLFILVFLLLCAKRGAILCAIISILIYFRFSMQRISGNKVLSRIFGLAIIATVVSLIVSNIYSSSELLQERLIETQEGNSSERDIIYAGLWIIFMQSDVLSQIFGHGMSQTVPLIGGYAHNDWLELLTNEGVLGVLLYASIFFSFINFYRKHKNTMEIRYKFIILVAVSCWFLRSIISMGYMAPESALFCIALGFAHNAKGDLLIKQK